MSRGRAERAVSRRLRAAERKLAAAQRERQAAEHTVDRSRSAERDVRAACDVGPGGADGGPIRDGGGWEWLAEARAMRAASRRRRAAERDLWAAERRVYRAEVKVAGLRCGAPADGYSSWVVLRLTPEQQAVARELAAIELEHTILWYQVLALAREAAKRELEAAERELRDIQRAGPVGGHEIRAAEHELAAAKHAFVLAEGDFRWVQYRLGVISPERERQLRAERLARGTGQPADQDKEFWSRYWGRD
ncbi:hypothetical protein [Actinomadura sp. 9N407]|uniref:hypothetical protein n=1 Tax=Actinomadura sp. 9N407 TaxID=3375154 RepID=UPI0037A2EB95